MPDSELHTPSPNLKVSRPIQNYVNFRHALVCDARSFHHYTTTWYSHHNFAQ